MHGNIIMAGCYVKNLNSVCLLKQEKYIITNIAVPLALVFYLHVIENICLENSE